MRGAREEGGGKTSMEERVLDGNDVVRLFPEMIDWKPKWSSSRRRRRRRRRRRSENVCL
jgi:hypothetical protein